MSKRIISVFSSVLAVITIMHILSLSVTTAASSSQSDFYTVQDGDTWRSLSLRFGTGLWSLWQANGVVNPLQLDSGERLYIPYQGSAWQQETLIVDIQDSRSALRAALRTGNPISSLVYVNGFDNSLELVGQRIYAPNRQDTIGEIANSMTLPPPTATPERRLTATSGPIGPTPIPENALYRTQLGVQGHFTIEEESMLRLLDMAAYDVGFGWVKQQVSWREFEKAPGQYNQAALDRLDLFVNGAWDRRMNVLLSIVKAPDWARTTIEDDGPPINNEAYYQFVRFIVLRYKFKVQAIEIWNEPNLGREWRGGIIHGAEYVELLAGAYDIIKSSYPEGTVTVVSAGLAPTGVNDGVNAISDRVYLQQMYEAGLANHIDVLGIHPYSWGNPPWTRCCGDWGGAASHTDDPTFFFLDTVEDYREIQSAYNDADRQMWATEFGWGTMDDLGRPTPPNAPFFEYVDLNGQAVYIIEAFQMGQDWEFMGPMFLWNFNIAALEFSDNNQSGYSILKGISEPRPAYERLMEIPKVDDIER